MRTFITLCLFASPLLFVVVFVKPVKSASMRADPNSPRTGTEARPVQPSAVRDGVLTRSLPGPVALHARQAPPVASEAPQVPAKEFGFDPGAAQRVLARLQDAPALERGAILDAYNQGVTTHLETLRRANSSAAAVREALAQSPVYLIDRRTLQLVRVRADR